ncbi:ABC-type nitrate/sulfonate/bicarbonate transport system permease component [Variovorax boronicumulans]|uniref:ABC transporter permease n=1 Tax=Variovorax boronicumulans TaxID=436515 RepID=UPI00278558D2|nr:ABC transporter permease [Variovorax boronicumulans]MDQ0074240.1 ABC-type nitrate/sulfonate/bicarbonate transport system permease component [Variovorax boronicumulans]
MNSNDRAPSGLNWLGSFAVLCALVALWWIASNAGWVSRVFLPTPQATFASLLEGLNLSGGSGNGELLAFTQATVGRMVEGWLLASLFGVMLGAAIGVSPAVRAWVQPTLEFIRPLPASALLPLAISIFGLNPGMVLFVVAFGAMWPVLLATVHGFAAVEPRLAEVARCLQMSRAAYIWKMGLPNAMPDILAGMRLALTIALIVAVVGEMIASQSGLGQAILLAARAFRASDLFAGIVLLGLIGFGSNALLAFAEKRLLRWQQP